MTPTPEQIAAGVAEAKKLIAEYAPPFLARQISDEQITQGVTEIVTAALAAGSAS